MNRETLTDLALAKIRADIQAMMRADLIFRTNRLYAVHTNTHTRRESDKRPVELRVVR